MNDVAEVHRAEGKIQLAKERLARRYPFHVAVLGQMRIVARRTIATVAVTFLGEDLLLLHNPRFVLACPVAELVGVLLHELHHVFFGHITMNLQDYPDRWAMALAQEVTVNEYIVEPLPAGAVKLEQFPELPPRESTRERYYRLEKTPRKNRPLVSTLDDHSVWYEIVDQEQAEAAIVQAVEIAAAVTKVPQELREILKEHIGMAPDDMQEAMFGEGTGTLQWGRLLRRYVGHVLEVRLIYGRVPRRFPRLVGIMPSQGRRSAKPKILAVIDTSASIRAAMLSVIDAELRQMARHSSVVVVECDAAVHAVYDYRPLKAVHGRGGTDLRPPFERRFLRQQRADVIIYFTDGYGPAPEQPPGIPVIWCLTKHGEPPAAWGKVLRME
jgi:predicted metal-dependent peptidase